MKRATSIFLIMSIACNYSLACKKIEFLERDWKKGGNAALDYDLNQPSWYCCNIFAQALHKNKDADFIKYLIQHGADVHKMVDTYYYKWFDETGEEFCFPLGLASVHRNPAVVKVLIDNGAAKRLDIPAKHAILIHFTKNLFDDISEFRVFNTDKEKMIRECIECFDTLINAGLPLDNSRSDASSILRIDMKTGLVTNYSSTVQKDLAALSPLKIVVEKKCLPLIEFFLKKGADMHKKYGGKSAYDVAQEKNLFQKSVGWLIKPKKEKNILEQQIDKIKADEAQVLEEERLQQKAEAAAAIFKENKRLLGRERLIKCITNNTKLIDIAYLLSLQRT